MDPNAPRGFQLDRDATSELAKLLAEVRERVLSRASLDAKDHDIGAADVRRAYDAIGYPDPAVSDAQRIVSTALAENRIVEWFGYGMAAALFVAGMVLVFVGVFGTTNGVKVSAILAGTVFELLLLFPIRVAVNSRRHNIAIRMLGILLDRVHDPNKLSQILAKHFKDTLFPDRLGLK